MTRETPEESAGTPTEAPDMPRGAEPDSPSSPPPARRRLTRSRTDEWFGGVAGGLAEYFDTDPTLIRVAFVLAAILSSGFAILAYIVAWIVIPEAGVDAAPAARRRRRGNAAAIAWGGILIIGGALVLMAQLDLDWDFPSWRVGLSGALILVGALMLLEARRGFHGGLVTLAVIITVLLAFSTTANFNLGVGGAFGDQRHHVSTATDLRGNYSHVFGTLTVDLTDAELPEGTTEVSVNVVFGEGRVNLPDDVPYRVSANAVFGSVQAGDLSSEGIANSRTYTSPGYAEADRRLDIEMSVVFGSGMVR